MLGMSAESIGTFLTGLGLAIIAILGGKAGKEKVTGRQPGGAPVMEVAGAIVSDKAVERMVKSLDEFSSAAILMTAAIERDVDAKKALTRAMEKHGQDLKDNTEACVEMGRSIDKVDAHIGKLATEMEIQRAISDRGGK